jgi:hypothetical protein
MIENARLDRLLTQVNCRMTSITRLRDAGAISNRKAELKQEVELRAKLCGRSTVRVLPLTPRIRLRTQCAIVVSTGNLNKRSPL